MFKLFSSLCVWQTHNWFSAAPRLAGFLTVPYIFTVMMFDENWISSTFLNTALLDLGIYNVPTKYKQSKNTFIHKCAWLLSWSRSLMKSCVIFFVSHILWGHSVHKGRPPLCSKTGEPHTEPLKQSYSCFCPPSQNEVSRWHMWKWPSEAAVWAVFTHVCAWEEVHGTADARCAMLTHSRAAGNNKNRITVMRGSPLTWHHQPDRYLTHTHTHTHTHTRALIIDFL